VSQRGASHCSHGKASVDTALIDLRLSFKWFAYDSFIHEA
jgi:hypothetical protein